MLKKLMQGQSGRSAASLALSVSAVMALLAASAGVYTHGAQAQGNHNNNETKCEKLGYDEQLKVDPVEDGAWESDDGYVIVGIDVTHYTFGLPKKFDWSATEGIDAVFLEGKTGSDKLYEYSPEALDDEHLTTPGTTGNSIDYVVFCYDEDPEPTAQPTKQPTKEPTKSPTHEPTREPTRERTPERTATTPAKTQTPEVTPSATNTPETPTATNTPENTPTHTATSTNTPENTPTSTNTPENTPTSTNTPENTPTSTNTPENTPTKPSSTSTPNRSRTSTSTPRANTATSTVPANTPTSSPESEVEGVAATPTKPAGTTLPDAGDGTERDAGTTLLAGLLLAMAGVGAISIGLGFRRRAR